MQTVPKMAEVLSSGPEIVSGAVVFKGTRVPVDALFENLAGGMSLAEFLDNFPTVDRQQAEAALQLAAAAVNNLSRGLPKDELWRSK
jgi:uncharacterized protein (DUF433 family)